MSILSRFLLAFLLLAGSAAAQITGGGGGGQPLVSSPNGTSTTLPFFAKYMGYAPEDFGASGNAKWCYDGNITSGSGAFTSTVPNQTISNTALTSNVATITVGNTGALIAGQHITISGSTNGAGIFNGSFNILAISNGTQFTVTLVNANVGSNTDTGTVVENCAQFTASDIGKVIDIIGAGAAGVTYHGTITAFTSATAVTVSPTASTTVTASSSSGKFLYANDDTTAILNWCAAVAAGTPTATGLKSHQGYLTKWYYITQPCRIVNSLGSNGFTQQGFGSPEPFNNANATEGLSVYGTGALNSGFAMAPQGTFNFNCPVPSANGDMGVFYYKWWNGIGSNSFGIIADSGSTYNTTACTGTVALYLSDGNGHDNPWAMEIEDAHNTTSTFVGDMIVDNCFESHRHDMVMYNNDQNGNYGQGIGGGTGATWEQCYFDGMVWEGWQGTASNVAFFAPATNAGAGSGRITNSRIIGQAGHDGTGGELAFASTFATAAGDCFIIENTDIQSATAGNYDVATNGSATGCLRLSNAHLINTASTAATNLIANGGGMNISMSGGALKCSASCVNGVANTSGSFTTIIDTINQGGFAAVSGSGASSVAIGFQQLIASSTGWSGTGFWQASLYSTNTNCASSASPAVCGSAASGDVAVPTGATPTLQVNTTAVTANSQIQLSVTEAATTGTRLGVTCNTTLSTLVNPVETARVAGTSFTIQMNSTLAVNPACIHYTIMN
jgi:hypothetical protein